MQKFAAHSQSGCVKARLGERVPQVHPKQLQVGLIQAGELQVGPLARTGLLVERLQVVRLIVNKVGCGAMLVGREWHWGHTSGLLPGHTNAAASRRPQTPASHSGAAAQATTCRNSQEADSAKTKRQAAPKLMHPLWADLWAHRPLIISLLTALGNDYYHRVAQGEAEHTGLAGRDGRQGTAGPLRSERVRICP